MMHPCLVYPRPISLTPAGMRVGTEQATEAVAELAHQLENFG